MIRGGDAIEVKKTSGYGGTIQLNSSLPKAKLYSDDSRIQRACVDAEDWDEKDFIYSIGSVIEKKLKLLFFIYGDCYCANREIYLNFQKTVEDAVDSIEGNEPSNELGRFNGIDPLGISDLRIRGMWIIKHPLKVFREHISFNTNEQEFSLICIMKKSKFESFNENDRNIILNDKEISYKEIKIADPNNPIKFIDAVLIRYDAK